MAKNNTADLSEEEKIIIAVVPVPSGENSFLVHAGQIARAILDDEAHAADAVARYYVNVGMESIDFKLAIVGKCKDGTLWFADHDENDVVK